MKNKKKVEPVEQLKKRMIWGCVITSFVVVAFFVLQLWPGLHNPIALENHFIQWFGPEENQ